MGAREVSVEKHRIRNKSVARDHEKLMSSINLIDGIHCDKESPLDDSKLKALESVKVVKNPFVE